MVNKGDKIIINGHKGEIQRIFNGYAYVVFPMINHRHVIEDGWYPTSKMKGDISDCARFISC